MAATTTTSSTSSTPGAGGPRPPTPASSLGIILSSSELEAYQSKFGADRIIPETPTPFQRSVLLRKEKEIALLGGKHSGKSWAARAFLLKGNPDLPNWDADRNPLLVNQSYIYHNGYRATILRRNQIDLDDFVRRFHQLVRPYGGVYKNAQFVFPGISDAVISVGHLADKDAWQKYIGVENIRFVIEEAALLPDIDLYEQILTCCRSVYTELRPQVLITSNAGGPGTGFLIERFYEAKDPSGTIIPPGQTIYETHPDPYDPTQTVTTTRVFMFSTMQDNPHAVKDPTYKATMAALTDEKIRKAYIYGDWRVFTGTYFEIFRPRGPNLAEGEPVWANHVIPTHSAATSAPTSTRSPAPALQSWWPRLGALDVGYAHETAVGWACRLPNSQHHIYREFVTSQSSFVQIGYELAKRTVDELNLLPSHSIPFYCSPDAFSHRMGKDAKSIIELVAIGIAKVIGPDAVHLPDLRIRQLKEAAIQDQVELSAEVIREIRSRRHLGITLHAANDDRVIGWQYCREALRWTTVGMDIPPYDPELAQALLLHNPDQYEVYTRIYQSYRPEVLPKLQIWDCCPRLIQAIPKARHYAIDSPGKSPEDVDKTHFTGMDSLDMWRYLEMGLEESFAEEPYESFRDRRMDQISMHHPEDGLTTRDRVMAHMAIEHQWAGGGAGKSSTAMILANAPRKSRRKKHEEYLARVRGLGGSNS